MRDQEQHICDRVRVGVQLLTEELQRGTFTREEYDRRVKQLEDWAVKHWPPPLKEDKR